uniref:Uncharacterized protein n=1 Tax=viral metagenome TaxID=1070528 RepID=A0A6C0JMW2_9ZZZZ
MRSKRNNKTRNNKTRNNKTRNNKTKKQKVMKGGLWVNKSLAPSILERKRQELYTKTGRRKVDIHVTSFDYLLYMLSLPCKVVILHYTSLSGFIFKIIVDPSVEAKELPFSELTTTNVVISRKPAYSIVIKLVVLSFSPQSLSIPHPEPTLLQTVFQDTTINKYTQNPEDFKKEATTQSEIYIKTLAPSGKPSCLSVIDCSILDTEMSKQFLDKLLEKVNVSALQYNFFGISMSLPRIPGTTKKIIDSIEKHVWNKRIGILSMQDAGIDCVPLHDVFLLSQQNSQIKITHYCEMAIAHLLKVFLTTGRINLDVHAWNVLINITQDTCSLIDFGQTLDIYDIPTNIKRRYEGRMTYLIGRKNFPNKTDATVMGITINGNFDKLIEQMRAIGPFTIDFLLDADSPYEIIKRVILLLHLLSELDFAFNSLEFDTINYQMLFLLKSVFSIITYTPSETNGKRKYFTHQDEQQRIDWYIQENIQSVQESAIRIHTEFKKLVLVNIDRTRNPFSKEAIEKGINAGYFTVYPPRVRT